MYLRESRINGESHANVTGEQSFLLDMRVRGDTHVPFLYVITQTM